MTEKLEEINAIAEIVGDWFYKHNILAHSNYDKQLIKFAEEVEEIDTASNEFELLDAIGDTLVVCVGLSMLNYKRYYSFIHTTPRYSKDLTIQHIKDKRVVNPYCTLLDSFIDYYGVDKVLKGFKMAALTIHFRTGQIVDGIFVKDKPTNTILVPNSNLIHHDINHLIYNVERLAERHRLDKFKIDFSGNAKLTWI